MNLDTVIQGDCMEMLKTLPDQSINCCVTSPPYYGLRDYGTGEWVGGDPNCPHKRMTKFSEHTITGHAQKELIGNVGDAIYKTVCPLCGAVREDKQIGLEETPEEYIDKLVQVFREVKRVLKDDGTLWVNIGDSYAGTGSKGDYKDPKYAEGRNGQTVSVTQKVSSCKNKDMIGIPWMLAFALRADGWYLRQDIIWHKPNPMPESVTDRCTKSHEYIFLLSKKPRYYFDHEAIQEIAVGDPNRYKYPIMSNEKEQITERPGQKPNTGGIKKPKIRFGGSKYGDSEDPHYATKSGNEWNPQVRYKNLQDNGQPNHTMHERRAEGMADEAYIVRNKRDVWSVTTKPCKEAHFAVFPEDLIEPCILAGCPAGGVILDPFFGSGTTGRVAHKFNRHYVGIELNPDYIEISERRTNNVQMTMEGFI